MYGLKQIQMWHAHMPRIKLETSQEITATKRKPVGGVPRLMAFPQ